MDEVGHDAEGEEGDGNTCHAEDDEETAAAAGARLAKGGHLGLRGLLVCRDTCLWNFGIPAHHLDPAISPDLLE
ncbi:hypothetical protein GCM10009657_17890 [Oryzihumus leptocrescens]